MDKWLSHPTALKIISLVIGILLWAVVHFDSDRSPNTVASLTETKEIDAVQVKAIGMDEKNFALRSLEPSVVHLTVRGSRSELLSASPDDFQVTVDLSKASEGRMVLPVMVNLPRGLERIDVKPSNVTVVLERILTKEYEVSVKTEGTAGKGYKTGQPIVKPNNRVHVTLPKDQMDEVAFVGGTVSIDGEEETVNEKKMKVVVLDKNGNEMSDAVVNPSVVEVEIPITKPFKKLPLQFGFTGKLPDGLAIASFKPSVETVTVYGPQDVLDKYDFYDGLNIDLSKLTQSGSMELDIKPEEGLATVDPVKVTIEYTIVPETLKVLSQLKVTMIGLSDGLKSKLTLPADGTIDVTVRGAPLILGEIEAKDVQLIADLSGLGPGSHVIPLDVHLPRFVNSDTAFPLSITVEISDSTPASATPTGTDSANGATDGTADTKDPGSGTGAGTESGTGAGTESGTGAGAEETGNTGAGSTNNGTDANNESTPAEGDGTGTVTDETDTGSNTANPNANDAPGEQPANKT
ncbi:CdaR family protein [Paenibacillus solisilvae]|uniref:CdaR family protein n=1 Tax=Paenibacillus solisilvae TaxID=2486751 RepID=A0ABW0VUR9_9BACL